MATFGPLAVVGAGESQNMTRSYPRKVEITRAIEAAKACGLEVAGIELSPSGSIRILGPERTRDEQTDFDKWQGLL
jgi:hypothetical protein